MIRAGSWMQTYTGRQFWPIDPMPEEVDIEDIAHSLSMQCRYNGHCQKFYSVAEHSVYVSYFCEGFALEGLLHDAAEAYVCDVPKPLKPFLEGYAAAEARVMYAVSKRFGLRSEGSNIVDLVDLSMLAVEKEQVMGKAPADWNLGKTIPLPITIAGLSPEAAKKLFLLRFAEVSR